MKVHRFLLNKNNKQPLGEELLITEKELLHQWNNVLKFVKGEKIIFFDGVKEEDYLYTIKDINNKSSLLIFDRKIDSISQKKEIGEINLCISLVKKEKISLIIEKCAEIGVLNFISLVSDRTEKKNIESFNKDKLIKIAQQAIEQSGWAYIPNIHNPKRLDVLIKEIESKGDIDKIVVLDTNNKINNLNIRQVFNKNKYKYIFIGPEGGWNDKEIAYFKTKNITFITFGKNVLRTETAAIVSTFLLSI